MNKKVTLFYSRLFAKVKAVSFIFAVLIIPIFHSSELFHHHESSAHDCCHMAYGNNELKALAGCESPSQPHDCEHCPICFFHKYLSGIKYYPLLPTGKNIPKILSKLEFHKEDFLSIQIKPGNSPRAPPA